MSEVWAPHSLSLEFSISVSGSAARWNHHHY